MATINTTGIFPNTKFISTDATGDLQEVVSSPQSTGVLSFDGLTFTAQNAGALTPAPSVELVEDVSASGVEVSVTGSAISIKVQSIASTPDTPATVDSLTHDGITYKAEQAGDSNIQITIDDNSGAGYGADSLAVTGSGTAGDPYIVKFELDGAVASKTQGDIANLYAIAGSNIKDLVEITVTNVSTNLTAGLDAEDLIGGNDIIAGTPATTVTSYTQNDIKTAYDLVSDATSIASLSIANGSSNLTAQKASTEFNGAEEVVGNLLPSTDYILLSRTDLHDLADSEKDDGRKFMWGLIHKAESVFSGLGSKPENFTISKGNPSSVDNGTALRQNYSISAKYAVDNLDLKSEA